MAAYMMAQAEVDVLTAVHAISDSRKCHSPCKNYPTRVPTAVAHALQALVNAIAATLAFLENTENPRELTQQ